MGLFDLFDKKKKAGGDVESLLIGYLRVETSKHLGHPVDSKAFDDACASAGKALEASLVPLLDKGLQQQVYDTVCAACPTRSNEAFGQYMVLLFVRFCVIQGAIMAGKVKPEEATLDIVTDALHKQMKRVIAQFQG